MTVEVTIRLLNELWKDRAWTQQVKADLAQKLLKQQEDFGEKIIPHVVTPSKTKIYQQIMRHTKPCESIM